MNTADFKEIKNPYPAPKPVKDPRLFFGRTAKYTQIKKYLSENKSIALIGERKIGKTSLFWYLKRVLVNDGFVPIYIDLQGMLPRTNATFLRTLLDEIKKELLKFDEANIISADLQKISLEINRDESVSELFRRILNSYESCLKRLREKNVHVKSFVIMIDEIELLKEFNGGGLFSFLRSIIEERDYVVFVVAGHDVLLNITKDESSPFFNMFKNIQLKGISEDGAKKLIHDPVADYGVTHDEQSVERILKLTGRNPYYIQVICGEFLIRILNQKRRYNVTFDDVEKAKSQFFEPGIKVWLQTLEAMWKKANNINQQLILSIIAEHSGCCTKHDVDSYLDNAVDDLRGEINQNLRRLSELGLLYNEGERYFIPSELFQIWIKVNHPTNSVLPKITKITNSEKRRNNNKQITINITGENEVQIGKIGDGSKDQITLKIKISKNDKEKLEKTSRELPDFIKKLNEIYDQTKEIPELGQRYEDILSQLKNLVTPSDLKDIDDKPERQSELKGKMSYILNQVDSKLTKTADQAEKYKETNGKLYHKIKTIADSKIIKETKKLVESVATSAVAGVLLKALEVAICVV
jgi:hypothetical protein